MKSGEISDRKSLLDYMIEISENNPDFTEDDIINEACTFMLAVSTLFSTLPIFGILGEFFLCYRARIQLELQSPSASSCSPRIRMIRRNASRKWTGYLAMTIALPA